MVLPRRRRDLSLVGDGPDAAEDRAHRLTRSPATKRARVAYEELIEAEYLAAETLEHRRPDIVEHEPGWCEGVRATLRWAWRRSGPRPVEVPAPALSVDASSAAHG